MRKSYLTNDIDVDSPLYVFFSVFSDDYCVINMNHNQHIDYTKKVSHQYVSSHKTKHWESFITLATLVGFFPLCVLISSLRLLFYRKIYHLDHIDMVYP